MSGKYQHLLGVVSDKTNIGELIDASRERKRLSRHSRSTSRYLAVTCFATITFGDEAPGIANMKLFVGC